MHAACPAHILLLDLITLTIFGEESVVSLEVKFRVFEV
jgi:hypothetical protein